MKAEAARAYWKRNNFDLIRGQFYDQSKEEKFLEERKAKAKVHGQDFCKKLPLSVQK